MPEVNHITRRERERLQRRRDIQKAAKAIFARDGYEKASLDEVAALCELSKGSIYYYFDSKEALFNSIIEDGINELIAKVDEYAWKYPFRESIRNIIQNILMHFEEDREFMTIFFHEKRELHYRLQEAKIGTVAYKVRELIEKISEVFALGIKNDEIRQFDPKLLALYMIGFVHTLAFEIEMEPGKCASLLTDLFFNGINKQTS